MLASRRRENPSRGRRRGRRQHRPSRLLRDLVGPGDPVSRTRHRLLRLVRGGAPDSQWRRIAALRPADRACPTSHAASGRHGHQPAVHHAADHGAARAPPHRARSRHRLPGLVPVSSSSCSRSPCGSRSAPAPGRRAADAARRSGHAAAGDRRRRDLCVPAARPDRRHHRARPRRRLRGLAQGSTGCRRLLAWRSPSPRPSRTSRSGSASGCSPGATGERSAGRRPAAPLVAAVSLALVGPSGLGGFVSALGFAFGNTPGASTLGIPGPRGLLARQRHRPGGHRRRSGSLIALGGCATARVAIARQAATALEASLAGAVALSLAASPHLLPHDLVILAPAFAWCAARAAAAETRAVARSRVAPR